MAKKDIQKSSSSRLSIFLIIAAVGLGSWWLWHENPLFENSKDQLLKYIDNQDIATLESKFTPQQIIDIHKQDLLATSKHTLQEPVYKYYPYLLLDVKYTEDQKSREGFILWGMVDGEMVLNTDTWDTTHGFKDCLECQATRTDFRIIQTLAKHQGSYPIEGLQKELAIERETLDKWIESAKQKHLIVQKGTALQLHFENPILLVTPQTRIKQQLVSKPSTQAQKEPRTFSRNQILTIAKTAFGDDFKVRSEREIFLPVYSLQVINPDGSIQTSEWNALTGQSIQRF